MRGGARSFTGRGAKLYGNGARKLHGDGEARPLCWFTDAVVKLTISWRNSPHITQINTLTLLYS